MLSEATAKGLENYIVDLKVTLDGEIAQLNKRIGAFLN